MPTQEEIERAEIKQKYRRFPNYHYFALVPIVLGFSLIVKSGFDKPSNYGQNYQTPIVEQYFETCNNLDNLLDLKSKIEKVSKHENLFAEPKEYISNIASSLEKTIAKTNKNFAELAEHPQVEEFYRKRPKIFEEHARKIMRNVFYGILAVTIGCIGDLVGQIKSGMNYCKDLNALDKKYFPKKED